ncbi:hypothetical protein REPUB_Repub08aG0001500 [Reevesia pubescens]
MRLYVYVLQAKDLAVEDTYVKLQVGKFKSKTRCLRSSFNPVWNEESVFRVNDVGEQLVLSVFHHHDDSAFFNASKDLFGRVTIPVWLVADQDNQTLPPTWLSLDHPKTGKFINKDCGRFEKLFNKNEETSRTDDSSLDISTTTKHKQHEMPENFEGGILLDQMYALSSYNLNRFLFAPDSQFWKYLAELQGATDVQEGPWTWKSGDVRA